MKATKMLFLSICLAVGQFVMAQENITISNDFKMEKSNIKVYLQHTADKVSQKSTTVYAFLNTTDKPVTISWVVQSEKGENLTIIRKMELQPYVLTPDPNYVMNENNGENKYSKLMTGAGKVNILSIN